LVSPPKVDDFMEHALKYNWVIPVQSTCNQMYACRIDGSIEHTRFTWVNEVSLRKKVWSIKPSIDPTLTFLILYG